MPVRLGLSLHGLHGFLNKSAMSVCRVVATGGMLCLSQSQLSQLFFWGSVLQTSIGVLGCANLKSGIRPMQFRDEPKNSALRIFCAKYRKKHRDKGFLLVFWCLWGWNLGYFVPDFGVTCLGETLQMVDNKSFSVKAFQSYSCYS